MIDYSYRVCSFRSAALGQCTAVCACSHFHLLVQVSCSILVSRCKSIRRRSNQHDGHVLRLRLGVACHRYLMCWSEFDLGFTYTELSAFFSFLCIFWKYGKRNVLWIIQRGGEVDFWLAQLVTFFRVYDTIDSYAILLVIITL